MTTMGYDISWKQDEFRISVRGMCALAEVFEMLRDDYDKPVDLHDAVTWIPLYGDEAYRAHEAEEYADMLDACVDRGYLSDEWRRLARIMRESDGNYTIV